MTLLLIPRKQPEPDPEPEKTRNRTGCANLFKKAMQRGERVTLDQAIAILRANW